MAKLPVDTALVITVGPLIDDTDFKTIETGVAYNATGIDVSLYKQNGTGAPTKTALTLTTGGAQDWVELGDGYYSVEITAAQNDTEGKLWLGGIATGILAFESYGASEIVPVNVHASLVAGTDNLEVDTVSVSGDATAADNLEATYDGTGYTDPNAPAKQSQLDTIANVGSAVNTPANAFVLTTGSEDVNTYTAAEALDGVYHELSDAAGVFEGYYEFSVGADGVPVSAIWTGYLNSSNDSLDVFAYKWSTASWAQVGTVSGKNTLGNDVLSFDMLNSYVGTSGVDVGKVRIRFYATSGLTSAALKTDQIFVSYAVVNRSVGYAQGAVWIDTIGGTAGTTAFINGTADNPVDSLADALSIAAAVGLGNFRIAAGSSLTLAAATGAVAFVGVNWDLALGGQQLTNTFVQGAHVTGISSGTDHIHMLDCDLGDCSLPEGRYSQCRLEGNITLVDAGTYIFSHCVSAVAGTGTPFVDYSTAGNTALNLRAYSGGVEVRNMAAGDTMSLEGDGQFVLAATCTGGVLAVRGMFDKTDNSGGAVTITETARITTISMEDYFAVTKSHGAGAWTATGGSGSSVLTVNVKDNLGANIQGVLVDLFASDATTFVTQQCSDVLGNVTFTIADDDYNLFMLHSGMTFTAPEPVTVSGNTSKNVVGTIVAASAITTDYEARRLGRQRVMYNDDNDHNPLVYQLHINGQKQTPTSATVTIYAAGSTTALVTDAACVVVGTIIKYSLDTTTVASWLMKRGYRAEFTVVSGGVTYPRQSLQFDIVKFILDLVLVKDQLVDRDDELLAGEFGDDEDIHGPLLAARDELQIMIEGKAFGDSKMTDSMIVDTGKFATVARLYVLALYFRAKGKVTKAEYYEDKFDSLWGLFLGSISYDSDGDGEEEPSSTKIPGGQIWRT